MSHKYIWRKKPIKMVWRKKKTIKLSYVMLRDLKPQNKIIHEEVKNDFESVLTFVKKISLRYTSFDHYDISKFFAFSYPPKSNITEQEMINIARDIWNDGYYVCNRFEKYYVIAFAKNYTRFEVFSKYCDKEIIDWQVPQQGIIKDVITDENYNENPVITLLKHMYS